MEHAPLRPVPSRPAGPIHPEVADRAVAAVLPGLAPRETRALALVALGGRPRVEVAGELGIGPDELAEALASSRKALRRSLQPLTASGWCERAERLISDRLDGPLDDVGAARLGVHLNNCPRCVEHERRLVQAIDALVGEPPPATRSDTAPAPVRLAEVRARRRSAIGVPPIPSLPFGVPVAPGTRGEPASVLPGVVASAVIVVLMALAAWAGVGHPLP
jgi:Putative zinc-finger